MEWEEYNAIGKAEIGDQTDDEKYGQAEHCVECHRGCG